MCQSDGENFIVSRGSQFVDGTRCESDGPPPFGSTAACLRGACQVGMTQRDPADAVFHSDSDSCFIWTCRLSAVSRLAATACCAPAKWGMSAASVTATDPPALWPLAPSPAARREVAHDDMKLLNLKWTRSRGCSLSDEVSAVAPTNKTSGCNFFLKTFFKRKNLCLWGLRDNLEKWIVL